MTACVKSAFLLMLVENGREHNDLGIEDGIMRGANMLGLQRCNRGEGRQTKSEQGTREDSKEICGR
jgi:hypothetical protein